MPCFSKLRTNEGAETKVIKDYFRKLFESGMNTEEANKVYKNAYKDEYKDGQR